MPSCDETFSELEFSDECGSNDLSFDCEDVVVEECEEQACVIERIISGRMGVVIQLRLATLYE